MTPPTAAPPHAPDDVVESIAGARHTDVYSVLGPHVARDDEGEAVVFRACRPDASRMFVVPAGRDPLEMARRHPAGVFEAVVRGENAIFDYRLRIERQDGSVIEIDDPYRYGQALSDFDLYLFAEGTHVRIHEKLGAHRRFVGRAEGMHFAVWAPTAARVSVVGDFNGWDPTIHPMRRLTPSGVWEIFIPDLPLGQRYKFDIRTPAGASFLKSDPFGVAFETPPETASITWDASRYQWGDAEWMHARRRLNGWRDRPMAIYEVHLGSWAHRDDPSKPLLTYRELADRLVPYAIEMGYTHLELLPVMEHPFTGSWGYQVIGFFAPTSRFGSPDDFKAFVDACHRAGLGVILDWVAGHFPKDAHGLARFDGTALFEHADPRQGEHQDWGTLIFNFGRHEVRSFLLSNALYWLDEYHLDGLRVDAVASMLYLDYSRKQGEWVPNRYGGRENLEAVDFLRALNTLVEQQGAGAMTIAEESTAWPGVTRPVHLGGLGFTYKWNMGWMHDLLDYLGRDPIHRSYTHDRLTFSLIYQYSERFILPLSHDEVVHGKRSLVDKLPGTAARKADTLRALYGYMYAHPGKKLLFMGGEFGQWREWNHDAALDWRLLGHDLHSGLLRFVRDLNAVYLREKSMHERDEHPDGFTWIDCHDVQHSVVSFVRRAARPDDLTLAVVNFTPVLRSDYRIGAPVAGRYTELLNSDAAVYSGANEGNMGSVESEEVPAHGYPQSLRLTLPPLSFLLFKPQRQPASGVENVDDGRDSSETEAGGSGVADHSAPTTPAATQ